MTRITCAMMECKHNNGVMCIADDIEISDDGFCLEYKPSQYEPDSPEHERDIKEG